jgi:egghead protein (zeste-white 4 protein)
LSVTEGLEPVRSKSKKKAPSVTHDRHGLHILEPNEKIRVEPRRDWHLGFITGHRLAVVLCLAFMIDGLYHLQDFLWPRGLAPVTPLQITWSWFDLLWLGAVIPGIAGLIGLLMFSHPRHLDEVKPIPQLVVWRIVSKGTNRHALTETIESVRLLMLETPLFRYRIEVVIEAKAGTHGLPRGSDITYYVVPKDYVTPKGSKFKARALQYVLGTSPIEDDVWLVHLDEETHPTSSGIKGIADMIRQEEKSGKLRIGQGAILYHRAWKLHPILTLADSVRVGDDLARFFLQAKLGISLFGLHGSFIVVRNDVEKSVGFDFGPHGSITEDAFFALKKMQDGTRLRWVYGYLSEQSTQSVSDFVKQRRRWYQGLVKVSLYAPVKFRWRAALLLNTFCWTLAPFAAFYTVCHLAWGFEVEPWVRFLANFSFASFTTLYVVGLMIDMKEHGITNWFAKIGWLIVQVILTPFFSFIEAMGVLMAMFKPGKGFHVVDK